MEQEAEKATLNRVIDESEADEEAGRTAISQEVFDRMEQKYPWLCNNNKT